MGSSFGIVLLIIGVILSIAIGIGLILAAIFVGQFVYTSIRECFEPGYSERRLEKLRKEQSEMRKKNGPPFWEKARESLFGGPDHHPWDEDMYGNLMYPEEFEEFARRHRR